MDIMRPKSPSFPVVEEISVLGIDFTHVPQKLRLIFGTTGLFTCYISYGIFHEWYFRQPELKQCGAFLTMYIYIIIAFISFLENKIFSQPNPSGQWLILFCTGACSALSSQFANQSLAYLNYPTQNLFKSSKTLPVMFLGLIILKHSYKKLEYLSMVFLCIGLSLFTMQDAQLYPEFNMRGVALVLLSLLLDGIYSNIQELGLKRRRIPSSEMASYGSFFGAAVILTILLFKQELLSSLRIMNQDASHSYSVATMAALSSYFGLKFIFFLMRTHGALVTVTVTTMRKALTIVLSFILYSKPFSIGYLYSGLLVVAAIYLNVYAKDQKSWNQWIQNKLHKKKHQTLTDLDIV